VSTKQELGIHVVTNEEADTCNDDVRITTTLTTVVVRGDIIIRGRLNKRALYGTRVEQLNPFSEP
jgi:hypothetical protein